MGEQEGGIKREKEDGMWVRKGASHSLKPTKFDTVTFAQHNKNTHTQLIFRGHRDPADDTHTTLSGMAFSLCYQRHVSLSVCPQISKRQGRKRGSDAASTIAFLVLTVCLRAS